MTNTVKGKGERRKEQTPSSKDSDGDSADDDDDEDHETGVGSLGSGSGNRGVLCAARCPDVAETAEELADVAVCRGHCCCPMRKGEREKHTNMNVTREREKRKT